MNLKATTCRAITGQPSFAPRLLVALLATACAIFLLIASAPTAIAAEGERVLDPVLSLTGGCGTTSVDPVPDPGPCPLEKEGGPGVPGVDHPPSTFSDPRAVATDDYGNIYVSSFGNVANGSSGRIDIFCSDGTFISELVTPGPTSLAVDSEGHLYVYSTSQEKVLRFDPAAPYQPGACEVEYDATPDAVVLETLSFYSGMGINRDNDHLFFNNGIHGVFEYSSAAEGNTEVRKSPGPSWGGGAGMAVDAERDRMYASAGPTEERIDIFDLNTIEGTPPDDQYKVIGSILPSSVPAGDFGTQLSVAVSEGNGNVFVLDGENCTLYEFEEDGTYLQTIPASFLQCANSARQIGIDNGPFSPNGKLSEEAEEGRYLYVPSNRTGIGHSYAFLESTVGPPEVKSIGAENVSEEEAVLRAEIDPNNLPTAYSFEYKAAGGSSWTTAGGGTLPTGNDGVEVSAAVTGLAPGTSYLFRVVAANEEAEGEAAVIAEASFRTYPSVATEPSPCANALLRTGPSALLPDCRAYELVTPGDTNGRAPLGPGLIGQVFPNRQVSPAGNEVPFIVEGGSLPGFGGTGSLQGDPYLAARTSSGWSTSYTGPSAAELTESVPGTNLADGHSFYYAGGSGSAVLAPNTAYVRYPDGHSELLGTGSLGKINPQALGNLISEGGGHIVFSTGAQGLASAAVQLEPEAAPDETQAVYDRTADGTTHVVSIKPGEVPFGYLEHASYRGASFDGVGIAFEANDVLYLRYDNEETFEVGTNVKYAGMAEGGKRVFYVQGDDLQAFDIEAGVIDFTTTGDAIPVTVASDGTVAYFVSETAIAESGPNPEGDEPQAGEQNLYRSEEGLIDFVGTVTERDVDPGVGKFTDALGVWVSAAVEKPGHLGRVPARSTPDGDAFLFKSRAALTGYDPEGHAQIYRYAAGELQCLSCNPTGAAATSDATLQSEFREGETLFTTVGWPENLRADGRRAFFESSEALVAADTDGLRDVYEWEEQGVGSCRRAGGCVYLVSSPQSSRGEYLWAISRSGNDVFFLSSDLLVGADADETPSIYDARVGGGFPEARVRAECLGEACQPSVSAPEKASLGSAALVGSDRAPASGAARPCSQGRRKAKRLLRRAKGLRRAARRAEAPRASRRMQRNAARSARQARRMSRNAKRCRQRQRRAER